LRKVGRGRGVCGVLLRCRHAVLCGPGLRIMCPFVGMADSARAAAADNGDVTSLPDVGMACWACRKEGCGSVLLMFIAAGPLHWPCSIHGCQPWLASEAAGSRAIPGQHTRAGEVGSGFKWCHCCRIICAPDGWIAR
jgi:hypothetical protein